MCPTPTSFIFSISFTSLIFMSYQHEHIPYYDPLDGYSRIASLFSQYHKQLTKRDGNAIRQYLPRTLKGLSVLDLGWGDGRRAKQLATAWVEKRTIIDGTQGLLDRAPWRTETICSNFLNPLPIADESYDLIIVYVCCFALEWVEDLFIEARRCIKPWWRMLMVHHHERRPFVHDTWVEQFKIKTWHWPWNQITEALEEASREVDCFDVDTETKIFCCFPR